MCAGWGSYLASFSLTAAGQYYVYTGLAAPVGPVTQMQKWSLDVVPAEALLSASSVSGLDKTIASGAVSTLLWSGMQSSPHEHPACVQGKGMRSALARFHVSLSAAGVLTTAMLLAVSGAERTKQCIQLPSQRPGACALGAHSFRY